MKIKQVEYKKLFNLKNYEHEEIGFIAEPEIIMGQLESGKEAMAQLVTMTMTVHKAINILKRIDDRLDTTYASWDDPHRSYLPGDSICHHDEEIKRFERHIKTLKDRQKEVLTKEKKQKIQEEIEWEKSHISDYKKAIRELKREGDKLQIEYQKLKSAFKSGDFSFVTKSTSGGMKE